MALNRSSKTFIFNKATLNSQHRSTNSNIMEDYTATSNPKNATANTVWQLLEQYKKKHYKRTVGEISGRSPRSHHYRVYMQHVGPVFGFGRCSTEACPGKKNQWPSLLKLAAARNKCPKNIRPLGNCPALTTGA